MYDLLKRYSVANTHTMNHTRLGSRVSVCRAGRWCDAVNANQWRNGRDGRTCSLVK